MADALSAPVRGLARRNDWSTKRFAFAVTLAAAALGVAVCLRVTALEHASWWIAALVAVGAFAFGDSFIRHGQGLLVLAVLASVTLWVIADRDDHSPPEAISHGTGTIVALGDSYASGEGARLFFPGTDVTGGNNCRRSSNGYAYRGAQALGQRLVFLACSGALSDQIWNTGQIRGPQEAAVVGRRSAVEKQDS